MSDKARADRQAVEALLDQGVSRAEAVAQFDTDENFQAWYDQLVEDLTAAIS